MSPRVLVAGASSGIGLATARAFAAQGDTVHAAARREISEPGVTAHRLDVTDRAAVDALAAELPALDALIVAAGTNIRERRLHELTYESWDHLVGANLTGPFNLIKAFLPALRGGTLVVIGSVSGSYPDRSGAAYQAAKAGVRALVARRRLGPRRRGPLHRDPPGRRRHPDPRQPPRAPGRRDPRPDAQGRGRRRRVPLRRQPPAARLHPRAHNSSHRAPGNRQDYVAMIRLTLLTGVLALALAGPALADVPAGNLLQNPGGDAAAGAIDSGTQVPIPGWTVTGQFTTVAYGTPEFPTTDDSAKWSGGANLFAGGPDGDSNSASQIVDVSSAAADIDKGGVPMTLSALLGGFASQADNATVVATARDAAGANLAGVALAPVTPDDRQQLTTLIARSATATVPPGTRSIVVQIIATRLEGQYNDGYIDNVSLTLGGGTPVYNKTVIVQPSGTVLVKRPGSSTFTAVSGSTGIPVGSTVDTRKGKVVLTSVPKAGGAPQSATFYDGIFKITQSAGITNLTLVEALAPCKKAGAAASKPKTRKLWGSGKGAFRTTGKYSAATVRGTKWLVQDSCSGTLTRVTQGVVSVRDNVKHKTILVKAPHSYTAKPRR